MSNADRPARSGCPINFALEIFGDRWSLLVLRDLLFKSRSRYRELLAGGEGIATNVLADRLKRLENRGLICKEPDPADARQVVYKPTRLAIDLIPMLVEMIVWGIRNGNSDADPPFVQRFERDRDGLIADLRREVSDKAGPD